MTRVSRSSFAGRRASHGPMGVGEGAMVAVAVGAAVGVAVLVGMVVAVEGCGGG